MKPNCLKHNEGVLVCYNQKCKENAFMCIQHQCECEKIHQICTKQIKWNKIAPRYQEKLEKRYKFLEKFIQKISQFYTSILKQISIQFQQFKQESVTLGMQEKQKKFCLAFMNKSYFDIKSEDVNYIYERLQKNQEYQIKSINSQLQKVNEAKAKFLQNLKKIYEKKVILKINQPQENSKKKKLQLNSKITNDLPTIRSFFQPKIIKKINLLYRASQNEYCSKKFHQTCDNIPNTLCIIKTEFNKIIGGYTPLTWCQIQEERYLNDKNCQSFLFSLTLKQKLTLVEPKCAITNHNSYSIRFGNGADLKISHKCNQNDGTFQSSYANIGVSYKSNNFKENNQQNITKFCGQIKGSTFKIIQFQVFQIGF